MVSPLKISYNLNNTLRVDVLIPKLFVAISGSVHIRKALINKLFLGFFVKYKAPFIGKVKVSIVSSITKVTGCNYELKIVSLRMTLWEKMIPRKCEPGINGFLSIKAAISTYKIITFMNWESISTKRISKLGHIYILRMRAG